MKRILSLVLASALVGSSAFAQDSTEPAAAKPGFVERTQLRIKLAWWKALLFEMRKNDGLLQAYGTGNGPSSKNVLVGAVYSSLLPLAYTTLRYRKGVRARRVTEARGILASELEGGLSAVDANGRLLDVGLRESTAFKNAAARRVIMKDLRAQRLGRSLRYVRRIAVVGIVAAFVFDAGATWIQIAMDPAELDQKRGELEQLIDRAELQLARK